MGRVVEAANLTSAADAPGSGAARWVSTLGKEVSCKPVRLEWYQPHCPAECDSLVSRGTISGTGGSGQPVVDRAAWCRGVPPQSARAARRAGRRTAGRAAGWFGGWLVWWRVGHWFVSGIGARTGSLPLRAVASGPFSRPSVCQAEFERAFAGMLGGGLLQVRWGRSRLIGG